MTAIPTPGRDTGVFSGRTGRPLAKGTGPAAGIGTALPAAGEAGSPLPYQPGGRARDSSLRQPGCWCWELGPSERQDGSPAPAAPGWAGGEAQAGEERPFRQGCGPDIGGPGHQHLLEAGQEPWEPQERKAWEVPAVTRVAQWLAATGRAGSVLVF